MIAIASRPFGVSMTRIVTAWPSEKTADAGGVESRDVDEHVPAKIVADDESEASGAVEPLDLAGQIEGGRRVVARASRRPFDDA